MAWLISKALYESWPCSQAQEAESLEGTCSDGKQSAQSSVEHTQLAYLPPDKMTAFSRLSRFGMMFKPLTESRGKDLLMWFRGDFLAKIYPAQERAQELTEPGQACGSTWQELSVRYDRSTHSWRTAIFCGNEELPWSSVTLPKWGMIASGTLWQRPTAERPIKGIGSGLLPTPSGVNGKKNHTVGRLDEWGGSSNPFRGTEIGKIRCASFEEWMMGWPIGWTELTALGTDKFQLWLRQHGQ